MKTVGIVVFPDSEELDWAGPFEVFGMAAAVGADLKVVTLAETLEPVRCAKGLRIAPDHTLGDAPNLDVVLLPGGVGTRAQIENRVLLDWLRGVVNSAGPSVRKPVLELGALKVDTQSLRVWHQDKPVRVTPTEYKILHYLLINADRPVSADELVGHNFDGESVKTANEIPVYISRLRDKLGKKAIETVYGYGYRLAGTGADTQG